VTSDALKDLEARWRLGEIGTGDLHEVADELLTSGEDADALIRLFNLTAVEVPWSGAEVFEELLREWGSGSMSEADALGFAIRRIAAGVVAGSLPLLDAVTRAEAVYTRTALSGELHPELMPWRDLHEELSWIDARGLSYLGRPQAAVEADVLALAKSVIATGEVA
jgi:hypothetical protein